VIGIFHSPHKRRASVCGTAAVVSLRHRSTFPLAEPQTEAKPKQMTNFTKIT
jgi:hypothetical protein